MKTYFRDLEGALIVVTDVDEAIRQVADYINYLHQNHPIELQEFAKKRHRYWKDLFQKLGALKMEESLVTDRIAKALTYNLK